MPTDEQRPVRRRFVNRDVLLAAFADAPSIDAERFRSDLDAILAQAAEPGT